MHSMHYIRCMFASPFLFLPLSLFFLSPSYLRLSLIHFSLLYSPFSASHRALPQLFASFSCYPLLFSYLSSFSHSSYLPLYNWWEAGVVFQAHLLISSLLCCCLGVGMVRVQRDLDVGVGSWEMRIVPIKAVLRYIIIILITWYALQPI